jgi:hypothetical protein
MEINLFEIAIFFMMIHENIRCCSAKYCDFNLDNHFVWMGLYVVTSCSIAHIKLFDDHYIICSNWCKNLSLLMEHVAQEILYVPKFGIFVKWSKFWKLNGLNVFIDICKTLNYRYLFLSCRFVYWKLGFLELARSISWCNGCLRLQQ